jgi:phosphoserine phosphatase
VASFILVRHGEDVKKTPELALAYGSVDTPLTTLGHGQAEQVAQSLESRDIRAVHAPPLARTLETARHISGLVGCELVIDTSIVGRDMGKYARGGHKTMTAVATNVYTNRAGVPYFVEVPGAEPLDSLYDRLQKAYDGLVQQYADQEGDVVLVTQHFAGTLLRAAHDGVSLEQAFEYGDLGHTEIAILDHTPPQIGIGIHDQSQF